MAGVYGSEPQKPAGGAAKKKNSKQKKQMKQLIIMAVLLSICAGLITWTVMLMRERYAQEHPMTEQNSSFELQEMERNSGEDSAETTATQVPEFTEETTTTTSAGTGETTTATTTMTAATAPKTVTVQSVSFSKISVSTTKALHTTLGGGRTTARTTGRTTVPTTASSERTTHTEVQQLTPNSAPTAAQLPYNELLALYLGAQSQGNSAYFFDDGSAPTVVLHGGQAYRVVSPANSYSLYNWLGGTGGTEENPWQTGTSFMLKSYDENDTYIYYTSSGAENQVIGYYNCRTCDNIWARLHYYQVGVGWQVEYHIFYCNRPDSTNGSDAEIFTSTCDAQAMYESDEAVEQLKKELQNRGMSAGSWGEYKLVEANQQSDAIWNQAGSHNTGFAPQSGETYGVVSANASLYSASSTTSTVAATLPAGTLLSVEKSSLPVGSDMVPVQAKINGTWVSGFMQPEQVLAWVAH